MQPDSELNLFVYLYRTCSLQLSQLSLLWPFSCRAYTDNSRQPAMSTFFLWTVFSCKGPLCLEYFWKHWCQTPFITWFDRERGTRQNRSKKTLDWELAMSNRIFGHLHLVRLQIIVDSFFFCVSFLWRRFSPWASLKAGALYRQWQARNVINVLFSFLEAPPTALRLFCCFF